MGVFDLSGGVTLGHRVGVLVIFEQAGGATTSTGKWGTLAFHGVVRGWVAPRVWIEGGAGTFDLAYRLPGQSGNNGVTRLWAVSPEAAAGVDIFRGAHVTIGVLGRYSTATFGDFRISHFSVQVELFGKTIGNLGYWAIAGCPLNSANRHAWDDVRRAGAQSLAGLGLRTPI